MKKILILLIFLIEALTTVAQHGTFTDIRLVNGDSVSSGTTDGTAFYNRVSHKFRFRQNGSWVGLGSGSGSGWATTGITPVVDPTITGNVTFNGWITGVKDYGILDYGYYHTNNGTVGIDVDATFLDQRYIGIGMTAEHGFVSKAIQGNALSFAAFDDNSSFGASYTYGHKVSFQARTQYNTDNPGALSDGYSFLSIPTIKGSVQNGMSVNSIYHFKGDDIGITGGGTAAVINQYGFYIGSMTAATYNWAFYGAGDNPSWNAGGYQSTLGRGYSIRNGSGAADIWRLTINGGLSTVNYFIDASYFPVFYSNGAEALRIDTGAKLIQPTTVTAGGTTGAQIINKPTGTVNFAASASSLVVTNSLCTTSSLVFVVVRTGDTTATIKNVVPGSGSFTITLSAAATAETSVGFWVIN